MMTDHDDDGDGDDHDSEDEAPQPSARIPAAMHNMLSLALGEVSQLPRGKDVH